MAASQTEGAQTEFSRESASSTLNTASNNAATSTGKLTAREVLYRYYECYNAGDLASIEPLIAQDVSYHDMAIYEEPFEGKQEFMAYLRRVKATVPSDIKFVIDDATDGDSSRVGIMWHVECGPANTPFPFSRGCSFYTVNDRGQITHARDLVESPNKPGAAALQLLAAIAPVVRELGPASDPSTLKKLPIGAAALWAFYVGYISYIMLGTSAPGLPAYATPPDVLAEVLSESINLFWINSALSSQGLSFIPDVVNPPVSGEVFYAFILDAGLYSVWQAVLLKDSPSSHRFVPFFGLVAHLLAGGSPTQQQEKRKSQQ
ncbi:MAG: hypothetical protein WDW38_010294 [Sanguina aurantia]